MVANGTVVGVVGAVAGAVVGPRDMDCARAPLREPRQSPRRPVPPAVVGDRGRDGPRGRDRGDRRVVAGARRRPGRRSSRRCRGGRRHPNPRTGSPAPASSCWQAGSAASRSRIATVDRPNPVLIIAGTIATTFGMLFVGPLFIRGLAAVGRRAPIALRLALRDLAALPSPIGGRARRHQPRARDRGDRRRQRGRGRGSAGRGQSCEQPGRRLPQLRQRLRRPASGPAAIPEPTAADVRSAATPRRRARRVAARAGRHPAHRSGRSRVAGHFGRRHPARRHRHAWAS